MEKRISKEKNLSYMPGMLQVLLFAVPYGAFIVLYTDYLAYWKVGAVISIVVAVLVVAIALFNFGFGLLAAFFVLFTFPTYPRDILDIYSALQDTHQIDFYSIKYMKVAGFSAAQWMFFSLFFISLLRLLLNGGRINSPAAASLLKLLFFFITAIFLGTAISVMSGHDLYLREFISDLRFPILFIFGIFIAWSYFSDAGDATRAIRHVVTLLVLLLIVSGMKTIMFIIDDKMQGAFKLSFASPIYVTFPFLLALIMTRRNMKISTPVFYLLFFMGALSSIPDGRGEMIVYFMVILLAFAMIWKKDRRKFAGFLLQVGFAAGIFAIVLSGLVVTNERLWNFITYKASFFTGEMLTGELSHSPLARVIEFKNIIASDASSLIGLLLGRGAGGYFTFRRYALPFEIGVADYSLFERTRGIFFHPHLPLNYWLLKGGALGMALYGYIFYLMFKAGYKSMTGFEAEDAPFKRTFLYFVILSSPVGLMESYWQPDYIFLYSIIMTLAFLCLEVGYASEMPHSD